MTDSRGEVFCLPLVLNLLLPLLGQNFRSNLLRLVTQEDNNGFLSQIPLLPDLNREEPILSFGMVALARNVRIFAIFLLIPSVIIFVEELFIWRSVLAL